MLKTKISQGQLSKIVTLEYQEVTTGLERKRDFFVGADHYVYEVSESANEPVKAHQYLMDKGPTLMCEADDLLGVIRYEYTRMRQKQVQLMRIMETKNPTSHNT